MSRSIYAFTRAMARAAAMARCSENVAAGPRTSNVRPPSRHVIVLGPAADRDRAARRPVRRMRRLSLHDRQPSASALILRARSPYLRFDTVSRKTPKCEPLP